MDHSEEETEPVRLPVDRLLAKLAEHEAVLLQQKGALNMTTRGLGRLEVRQREQDSSSDGSVPITPDSGSFDGSAPRSGPDDDQAHRPATVPGPPEAEEMLRLKCELEMAKSKIARMDRELSQTRITQQSIDQLLASPTDADFRVPDLVRAAFDPSPSIPFHAAATRGARDPRAAWVAVDDGSSAHADASALAVHAHDLAIWGHPNVPTRPPLPDDAVTGGWGTDHGGLAHSPLPSGRGPNLLPRPMPPSTAVATSYGAFGSSAFGGDVGGIHHHHHHHQQQQSAPVPTCHHPTDALVQPRGGRTVSSYHDPMRQGHTGQPSRTRNTGLGVYPTDLMALHGTASPTSTGRWPYVENAAARPPHLVGARLSPMAPEFTAIANVPQHWGTMVRRAPVMVPPFFYFYFLFLFFGASSSVVASVVVDRVDGAPVQMGPQGSTTYVSPVEPLNYRRLLDRTVTCDWRYIVDKIVTNNDQQASIFLQQKLKVGTTEQKHAIVEAIVAQAYPLMVNRFGNFLIQRCFEHGTQPQVIAIANAIRGNTLSLSMDSFGCHVVQKAFDCVPEEYKAVMVHELLRRIPETVIHRYACHVWQKLFELRWNDAPPQIMRFVNEALRGMWHEVALGETGSLVVQNIFENCLEEDKVRFRVLGGGGGGGALPRPTRIRRGVDGSTPFPPSSFPPWRIHADSKIRVLVDGGQRPCVDEVLDHIDIIARGQFGNWCIQHVCEHGALNDRTFAIEHVLRHAVDFSLDQYASKVVEKCLKIGGPEFLDRYLGRVCESRPDRPRIPLIDSESSSSSSSPLSPPFFRPPSIASARRFWP